MPNDAARRFLALTVGEVSLVGEPANEEDWLVAKAKTEAEMATKAAAANDDKSTDNEGVDRVVVKQSGDSSEPSTIQVLKEVNGIVDNIVKLAKGGAVAPAPAVAATDADVEKAGMTFKGFMKAAGMSDDMMKTAEEKAKKSGYDIMKLMPAMDDAKGDKPTKKAGTVGEEESGGKTTEKPPTKAVAKSIEGDSEPLTLDGLIAAVTKGKTFTPGRVEKLRTLKGVIEELLGDVDPASERVPANLPAGKSPDTAIASISKNNVDEFTAAVEKAVKPLVDKISNLETELTAVKKARPASASVETEGGTDGKDTVVKKSMWNGIL